jgi:isopentenyl-diphosphate delta-isomerase
MADAHRTEHTAKRKNEHIHICLDEQVNGEQITNGFERYRFLHEALPEIDFNEISTSATVFGKQQATPLLISSMTGGTELAHAINLRLVSAAEKRGWAIGLGSIRAAIENERLSYSYQLREHAPNVWMIANIGAVQFNYGYSVEQCRKAVQIMGANALVLHLNSMQEVFQPEGDTNFRDLLPKIADLCETLEVPVGVKEVGWGINGALAKKLVECGVQFIDVAGAGGTSWSQVEKFRQSDELRKQAAQTFAGWGIPTAQCVVDVRAHSANSFLIASGGMNNGLEAAKAIALGADLVGYGRALLSAAIDSVELVERQLERVEFELRAAMFGIGVSDLHQLRYTTKLLSSYI